MDYSRNNCELCGIVITRKRFRKFCSDTCRLQFYNRKIIENALGKCKKCGVPISKLGKRNYCYSCQKTIALANGIIIGDKRERPKISRNKFAKLQITIVKE